MKKTYIILLQILLVVASFAMPHPAIAQGIDDGTLTFADMGLAEDIILNGPYDSSALRFDIPPTWQLKPGAVLELEISSYFVGEGKLVQLDGSNLVGATLDVYFNDKLLQTVPLVEGDRIVYRIPVSDDALVPTTDAGSHKLSFFLDAAVDCDLEFHKTTIRIDTNSKALLQYDRASLSVDLRRLPSPIYQERTKIIGPVSVVIPDSPSAEELQSALVIMGSFARMTGGKLPMNMISASQLTDEIKAQSHIILVGKPPAFPELNEMSLSVPLDGTGFFAQEGGGQDGIVQAIPSPWNDERVLLLVSGATDQSVIKSAQAVSTLNLQTGLTPDYSIIAQVNPISSLGVLAMDLTQLTSPDITFEELGFDSSSITGLGTNWQSYEFAIPPGQISSESPYIDLNYTVSEIVDSLRSEGVVYLNDIPVGSISLESQASNLITTRINLPASVLRSGINNIDIVINLVPKDNCSVYAFSGLWVTFYSDSVLHLPLAEADDAFFTFQDLRTYPYPFSNEPSLGSTTIVVPQLDFSSWRLAGKLAYDLGARITGPVLAFNVVFDGEILDELRDDNLIFIGQPKDLSLLSEFNDVMPAHFEDGGNVAVLDGQQVVYRVSDQKDLGYLELFSSPWNNQAVVLGVFGTSPLGLEYAVNALIDPEKRDRLSGNFATLDGGSSIVVDTRTGLGLGRLNANPNLSVDVIEPTALPQQGSEAGVSWLKSRQLVVVSILGVVLLMAAVVIVALRIRKKSL